MPASIPFLTRSQQLLSDKLLEEISKIYSSMEHELVNYLALSFDLSEPPDKNRAFLLALEGEEIVPEMAKARGSCGKITSIYRRYLAPWFSDVLDPTESGLMKELFDSLGNPIVKWWTASGA